MLPMYNHKSREATCVFSNMWKIPCIARKVKISRLDTLKAMSEPITSRFFMNLKNVHAPSRTLDNYLSQVTSNNRNSRTSRRKTSSHAFTGLVGCTHYRMWRGGMEFAARNFGYRTRNFWGSD